MLDAIKQIVVTEKSSKNNDKGVYVFKVKDNATKIDIKNLIKELYGASVETVKIINVPPKTKLGKKRNSVVKRHSYKKAIVKIKEGKTIDLNVFAKDQEKKEKKSK